MEPVILSPSGNLLYNYHDYIDVPSIVRVAKFGLSKQTTQQKSEGHETCLMPKQVGQAHRKGNR